MKKEVNNDRVAIFCVPQHGTVACGYITYEVSYKETTGALFWKKERTITEEISFVVINDGSSSREMFQYSYFPEELIDTSGLFNSGKYSIDKVR